MESELTARRAVQEARQERLRASQQRDRLRRDAFHRGVPVQPPPTLFSGYYFAVMGLILVTVVLWVAYGRSFSSGSASTPTRVALLAIPLVTLVVLIAFLRRRAAQRARAERADAARQRRLRASAAAPAAVMPPQSHVIVGTFPAAFPPLQ